MNWKKYEKEILKYFQETYPETNITFDRKIIGKYSKVKRQIDILIEGEVADFEIKIIVDCKNFSKNIDVKQVESFCSMIEDVEAHQGVMITQKGYSKAAINRAYYGNQKVELDIINFDELKEFQSYEAIPYVGRFSVIVPAPFGWVLDLKEKINSFASLHQRGLTLKEAQKKNEWMYIQFWKIDKPNFNIDDLIDIQNANLLRIDKKAIFTYKSTAIRNDSYKTKIRIAELIKYPALEVTGFIQFDEYIFFIVLFTPKELLNKNLRKLQYLLKVAKPVSIMFDNTKVIEQLLSEIELIKEDKEKADRYYQVGKWYKEMDNLAATLKYYRKAIECFPEHYTYLKEIIKETLSQEIYLECKKYSKQLLEIEPANSTVPQDLIKMYLDFEKSDILIELFNELISKYEEKDNNEEILGNLNFHLGILYFNIGKQNEALPYFKLSEKYFRNVFPKSHQIFKSISLIMNEINRAQQKI